MRDDTYLVHHDPGAARLSAKWFGEEMWEGKTGSQVRFRRKIGEEKLSLNCQVMVAIHREMVNGRYFWKNDGKQLR